jgi:hypothetical protein
VDRDGVSPKHSSDIEELNRRRADLAVGWATVEAQNRRRSRHYGLVGTAWAAGLAVAVTAAGLVPSGEPAAVPSGRADQLRTAIGDAGFMVETDPDAGLAARATPPTVKALRRNPADLANLGPLIGNLAALAAAEGVAPAPANLPAGRLPGGHGASTR